MNEGVYWVYYVYDEDRAAKVVRIALVLCGRRAARKPSLPTSTFWLATNLLKLMDEPKSLRPPRARDEAGARRGT